MRLGFGFLAFVAVALSACLDDRAAKLAADWGCGPVDGIAAISGDRAPDWLLVGEFTESSETPAAVADIACNLATDGDPIFVGVSQYLGGDTDAETRMIATLDQMIAKGAPLIVERIGDDDLPYALRNRNRNEEPWAKALMARVSAAKASRAVLLVAQADAIVGPTPATNDGADDQNPAPVFLPGKVVSLEAVVSPGAGLTAPSIRSYGETPNGFHGELAFNRMTRPMLAIQYPEKRIAEARVSDPKAPNEIEKLLGIELPAEEDAQEASPRQPDDNVGERNPDPIELPIVSPELDLPEFEAE